MSFSLNLDEYLIDEECIAISLMPFLNLAVYFDPNLLHQRPTD
jgi:hypothetical protein